MSRARSTDIEAKTTEANWLAVACLYVGYCRVRFNRSQRTAASGSRPSARRGTAPRPCLQVTPSVAACPTSCCPMAGRVVLASSIRRSDVVTRCPTSMSAVRLQNPPLYELPNRNRKAHHADQREAKSEPAQHPKLRATPRGQPHTRAC